MEEFSNNIFLIKFSLSIFILVHGVDPKKTIRVSKMKFWLLFFAFKNFKRIFFNILLRIDCKSTKEIHQKDVQNIFYFEIEFIKGNSNSLTGFPF